MTGPTVSVCIPAYNHETFVGDCIRSVLGQTFQDFEIVVTDDASTDGTIDAIESIRDERIRLFRNTVNLGPSATANRNMSEARGKYIAFLPSDDMMLPERLALQVQFLESNPAVGAVFGQAEIVDETGVSASERYPQLEAQFRVANRPRAAWLRYFFFHGNCLCAPTATIRRSLIDSVGLHDERLLQLQDFDYWMRVCLKHEIHVLPIPLICWRVQERGNLSSHTPEVIARLQYEHLKILQRFRGLESRGLFVEAFPEGEENRREGRSIELMLAWLALGADASAVWPHNLHVFGLDLLYDLLGTAPDPAVFERCGTSPRDFFDLVAKVDIFNSRALADLNEAMRSEATRRAEAEHALSEAATRLAALEQQLFVSQETLRTEQARATQAHDALRTEQARATQAEERLAALLRSKSWRATAPLRSLARLLKASRAVR
jgi:glycosyltransferase involved in cell wall biosynthesis